MTSAELSFFVSKKKHWTQANIVCKGKWDLLTTPSVSRKKKFVLNLVYSKFISTACLLLSTNRNIPGGGGSERCGHHPSIKVRSATMANELCDVKLADNASEFYICNFCVVVQKATTIRMWWCDIIHWQPLRRGSKNPWDYALEWRT